MWVGGELSNFTLSLAWGKVHGETSSNTFIIFPSFSKLSQLRGNNRKFTLLHALVEQIMLREPRLATFFLELAEFETVPGASVKGLTAEVDVVKNEFQKIVQYRKTYSKSKNKVNQHPKFFKDLKAAIEKHEADLRQLMKRCEEMRKLYTDILVISELLFQYLLLCCFGRRMGLVFLCSSVPGGLRCKRAIYFSPPIHQGYSVGFFFFFWFLVLTVRDMMLD
ncbi:uncharacterized protein LOC113040870 [Carassius auratus]|uniref:Uncharacterized protein LOC113040870 n=1 Tax=Carassius auratus TaxID=7957 RepID=A0A6P6J3T7_CARAU|nr:uncharacterized protein LOC113040870 [Carassius auratus]